MDLKSIFIETLLRHSNNKGYINYCWQEIEDNYTSKKRFYHNLSHLKNMLVEKEAVKDKIENHDVFVVSIFYHDIIYNSLKGDNELKSAELMKERMIQTKYTDIEKSFNQILATQKHLESSDNDTNYLLDIDLSVLGKSPEDYSIYMENVRKEYHSVPYFLYKKGRKKVLNSFLEREKIYFTDFFSNKYEKQANENLKYELSTL